MRFWDRLRWLAVWAAAAAFIADNRRVYSADDDEKLEQFLARLGLVDLHVLHLEDNLQRASSNDQRQEIARRLADMYTQRLLTAGDDTAKYDDILTRVAALVRQVPQANTPGLQVMLLQADFSRAESLINDWLDDRQHTVALRAARDILTRIAPNLKQLSAQLATRIDELHGELEVSENEEVRAAKQQEVDLLEPVVNQAAFFTGWANYYFGISLQGDIAAQDEFMAARAAFRRILGLADEEEYKNVKADWLALENEKRSQALIGLGLTEVALGNLADGRVCFQHLDRVTTPPAIRDRGSYWYLRGLLNAGLLAEAIRYAGEQIDRFSGGTTPGKSIFCVTLVRAAYSGGDPSAEQRRLGDLGVRGLAKLQRSGLIRELIEEYKIPVADDAGFYLTWIAGERKYLVAQQSGQQVDFQAAAQMLAKALADPEAHVDVVSAGKCRHYLALCHYHLRLYQQAAQEFQQAALALKEADRRTAIESAWNAYLCYRQLMKDNNRFDLPAIDALRSIKRDFPDSEEAHKADYHLAKLATDPKQRLQSLDAIKPGEPGYLLARFELCLLYHQKWFNLRADEAHGPAAAKTVLEAVDTYIRAAQRDADDEHKLQVLLLASDVALHSQHADAAAARTYLTRAEAFADSLPPSSSSLAEYHFRLFEIAKLASDTTSIQRHAQWLLDNAAGSSFERAAIISLAIAADQAVKSASDNDRQKHLESAARVYLRLTQLLGDAPEDLTNKKNSRVAVSKLAAYESALGRHAQAAARLDTLLAVFPKDEDYLKRAATAEFLAGQHQASVDRWRLLLAGLPKNSESWYEAKYYQIACLTQLDKNKAREVYQQFKLLHPNVPFDAWRIRFEQWEEE